jgi:hypothetical protein
MRTLLYCYPRTAILESSGQAPGAHLDAFPYLTLERANAILESNTKCNHCCPVDGGYDFSITRQDKGF